MTSQRPVPNPTFEKTIESLDYTFCRNPVTYGFKDISQSFAVELRTAFRCTLPPIHSDKTLFKSTTGTYCIQHLESGFRIIRILPFIRQEGGQS